MSMGITRVWIINLQKSQLSKLSKLFGAGLRPNTRQPRQEDEKRAGLCKFCKAVSVRATGHGLDDTGRRTVVRVPSRDRGRATTATARLIIIIPSL